MALPSLSLYGGDRIAKWSAVPKKMKTASSFIAEKVDPPRYVFQEITGELFWLCQACT